jgi:hypothetical protein
MDTNLRNTVTDFDSVLLEFHLVEASLSCLFEEIARYLESTIDSFKAMALANVSKDTLTVTLSNVEKGISIGLLTLDKGSQEGVQTLHQRLNVVRDQLVTFQVRDHSSLSVSNTTLRLSELAVHALQKVFDHVFTKVQAWVEFRLVLDHLF